MGVVVSPYGHVSLDTQGVPLATGEESFNRLLQTSSWTQITGYMLIGFWTAATTQLASKIITYTSGTGLESADCTLAQIAVFSVNPATSALTSQLAITANLNSTLWGSSYSSYTSSFTSPWNQVSGTLYAVGMLAVFSGTAGQISGANGQSGQTLPMTCANAWTYASMPTSVAATSLQGGPAGTCVPYFQMEP